VNRLAGRLAVTLAVAGVLLALAATAAAAHPLGNFSVNRYYGLVVSPGELRVDHVQDLAEIPAAQARSGIDTDGDGRPSAAELAGWARRACGRSAAELLISLDRRPIPAVARSATARLRPGQAGLPTLRLECAIVADLASWSRLPVWGSCLAAGGGAHGPGRHGRPGAGLARPSEPACSADDVTGSPAGLKAGSTIELRDRAPGQPGWREITARGDRMTLLASDVPQASRSDRLAHYPRDMLAAPADQRHATLRVRPGGPPLTVASERPPGVGQVLPRGADRLAEAFTALVARHALTPGFGALAVVVAVALGALHALAPGHGKTVMAAYAASRGRRSRREVLALGATVTVTHTAGVLMLGVLVATGSTRAPAAAIPWLSLVSGALVAVTGLGLLGRALGGMGQRGAQPGAVGEDHGHSHAHDRGHDRGHDHAHDRGHDHAHPHDHDRPCQDRRRGRRGHDRPRRGGVVLMGFAGGLVPSPSAVVVLVGAAALGKAWFGVTLVLAYGTGLALSLALVGVLVTGSGRWLARRLPTARSSGPGRWIGRVPARTVPVGSAALVVALGVGLALRGLPAVLG
jgi:nickel/cobalt exporter